MSCPFCEKHIEHSYDGNPFIPPGGSCNDPTFLCACGQCWWQYNDYYHLWSKVDNIATLRNIQRGCPEPVIIGNPSVNLHLSKEEEAEREVLRRL